MSRTPLVLPAGARQTLRTGGLKAFFSLGRINSWRLDLERPVHGQGPPWGNRIHSGRSGLGGGASMASSFGRVELVVVDIVFICRSGNVVGHFLAESDYRGSFGDLLLLAINRRLPVVPSCG